MPETRSPLIEIRGLDKVYHTPAGDFWALKNIDVDIYPGEFIGVLGKSGSGKSTLGNMITGIDHPTRGTVQVGGVEIHRMKEGRMSLWRGKNLGIVFQFFQLLPTLTVLENVLVPMDFGRLYGPLEREQRALDLLDQVGLADLADRMPDELSGGQQQSVAIARALANDPPLILADEPTGNLDTRTAESVMQILEALVHQGKTIMMVTHDSALARRTTRTLLLADGELVHPAVVAAFAHLPHRALLELTHCLVEHHLEPGGQLNLSRPPVLALVAGGAGQLWAQDAPGVRAPAGSLTAGAAVNGLAAPAGVELLATAGPGQADLSLVCISQAGLDEILGRYPALEVTLAQLVPQDARNGGPRP